MGNPLNSQTAWILALCLPQWSNLRMIAFSQTVIPVTYPFTQRWMIYQCTPLRNASLYIALKMKLKWVLYSCWSICMMALLSSTGQKSSLCECQSSLMWLSEGRREQWDNENKNNMNTALNLKEFWTMFTSWAILVMSVGINQDFCLTAPCRISNHCGSWVPSSIKKVNYNFD